MTKAMREQLYCGCCGTELGRSTRSDPDWCKRCLPHIKRHTEAPLWERTYFAQHKRDCPFQASSSGDTGEARG
ncbi:hypothetical protein ACL02T_33065 [Pseudonocardia sp. RS010]|uniref:hypothetical protein n=1 Tax=Pseudonocardia sp. RS010 TaxID=3385979 RepID=UPI0039A2997A